MPVVTASARGGETLAGRGLSFASFHAAAVPRNPLLIVERGQRSRASLTDALAGADAAVVMTAWDEFREVPRHVAGMAIPPVVIDGRRLLDRRQLSRYAGIGWRP